MKKMKKIILPIKGRKASEKHRPQFATFQRGQPNPQQSSQPKKKKHPVTPTKKKKKSSPLKIRTKHHPPPLPPLLYQNLWHGRGALVPHSANEYTTPSTPKRPQHHIPLGNSVGVPGLQWQTRLPLNARPGLHIVDSGRFPRDMGHGRSASRGGFEDQTGRSRGAHPEMIGGAGRGRGGRGHDRLVRTRWCGRRRGCGQRPIHGFHQQCRKHLDLFNVVQQRRCFPSTCADERCVKGRWGGGLTDSPHESCDGRHAILRRRGDELDVAFYIWR